MMRSRACCRRRPSCELLESRFALATVTAVFHPRWYPAGMVGPLPSGSAMAPPGQDTPGMGDQPPVGSWTSTAWNSIGAPVMDWVSAQGPNQLASVQYEIQGGAIASQTWTTTTSDYTRTQGITHTFSQVSGYPQTDSWNYFWDENPGTKTCTNTVTYTDGSQWVSTASVSTVAPTASDFQVSVSQAALGSSAAAGGDFGLWNGAGMAYGVGYQASITMGQVNGGTGGFIQVVNMQGSTTDFAGNKHGVQFPAGLFALDQPKGNQTPYFNNNYSVGLAANATTTVGGTPSQYSAVPTDTPGVSLVAADGVTPALQSASYTYTFKTYVDYQAPGGIHIELAEADWTVTGSASYNGPANPSQATFSDPSNWVVTANGVTGPNVSYGPQLIKWTMNVDDAKAQYSN